MKIEKTISPSKINIIEPTSDSMSNRGGLALFLRYIETIKFYGLVENTLGFFHKSSKGQVVPSLMKQIIAFFVDGTCTAISGFDALSKDNGYAAILEMEQSNLVSSHTIKRFFRKFIIMKHSILVKILHTLFVWRLNIECPDVILLDLDTMVLDNDDALKREGVNPTYKKKKGFQCLNITWEGRFITSLFRSGEKHSNHGDDVQRMVKKIVEMIRNKYKKDVPIILSSDSGFLSEENFEYFDDVLKIHFICSGKMYTVIKEEVSPLEEADFKYYSNRKNTWAYHEFICGLGSWKTEWRTIYTSLVDGDGQIRMSFSRPDNVIHTNIGMDNEQDDKLRESGLYSYLKCESIIELAHQRGTGELCHRSIKEFIGREHLPFKKFAMNGAYYYIMLISHFLFETFKRDVGKDVVSVGSYPNTTRRKLIDFAAKVVNTSGRTFLKVTYHIWESLNFERLWGLCNNAPKIRLNT